jgi:hypothetical protein
MIGMIQIERGNINEAIEAFLQGLNAPIKDPTQETVLCYEIGAAYEAKKMNKEALTYYQKAMRQVAVGADDEFDRAFEGLLSKV